MYVYTLHRAHIFYDDCMLISPQNIVADMRKVLAKNPQVEQQRLHRRVFLENVDPENQALLVSIRHFGLNIMFLSGVLNCPQSLNNLNKLLHLNVESTLKWK